jgi:ABC-2 type transport system permease protein
MQTFKTLLLREWMQHRLGWLLLGGIPLALMIPLMIFGTVQFGDAVLPGPGLVALIIAAGYTYFLLTLAGSAVAFLAPGLARRDVQDRSIEFWTSLPTSHTASVGATVLLNVLLMPLLVLGMAAVGAMIAGLIAVVRVHGASGLAEMPWGAVAAVGFAGLVRLALGIVLGVLWLSPLLLGAMAASAWLKRWGVPLLAAVLGLGGLLLDKAYDMPFVFNTLGALFQHFARAFGPHEVQMSGSTPLSDIAAWVWSDAAGAVRDLANPMFPAALAVAAACFALIVYRRARG